MSQNVVLCTERAEFERTWQEAISKTGMSARVARPKDLASAIAPNVSLIVDASSPHLDEDELLAMVGLARALGAHPAVALPAGEALSSVEEVLEELCGGLVTRGNTEVQRVATSLARRGDSERARRFEYVTVSPKGSDLLVILGDGSATLLSRPLSASDDNSDISSIVLSEDASVATVALESGVTERLYAGDVAARTKASSETRIPARSGFPPDADAPVVDGAKLGSRLRTLRQAAGLTQAELARRTGIHRPNIARVEAGRHTPSLETLARLASAMGVSTTYILAGD